MSEDRESSIRGEASRAIIPSPRHPVTLSPCHLPRLRVLVVDDDPDTRANLCDILELDNLRVETAGSVAEVLQRDNWSGLTAILLDRKLPDGTAEELLPRLRRLAPDA